LSETAVDFVKLCLNRSPEDRPKVDDLLKHPFIADMAPEMSDVLSPGTPSPRPVAPVIPRNLHRTSQTPANSRLVRQTSGRLREAIEEEESVSATVAALVDAPSPRASGSKGLGGVGSNSGKNLGGGPKSRPQTPPPNWSPSGDEPKPGPSLGARLRSQDLRGNAQEPKGTESQLKPRLRWKSPSSTQSNALSGDDAARSVEDSFRFGDPRIETRSPLPLTRHKSADAPTRRPLRTLLEDGPDHVGRLHKGVSVPLEVSRRKSTLEKGGEIDMFHTSKQMGLIER
jgi:serine/threonine protein kinase